MVFLVPWWQMNPFLLCGASSVPPVRPAVKSPAFQSTAPGSGPGLRARIRNAEDAEDR